MSTDISKYVEQIVSKLTGSKDLLAQFKADPVKAVTQILGVKLDGDLLQSVIKAVQGKLNLDEESASDDLHAVFSHLLQTKKKPGRSAANR